MVRVIVLDIQVSLRNLTAMLEDSMTSVKTLYRARQLRFLKVENEVNDEGEGREKELTMCCCCS